MKHFKLTETSKVNIFGITLFQIELTIDCKWGKKGDKGGWVEKEANIDIRKENDGFIFSGEIWGGAVIRGGVIRGGEIRGGVIFGGVIFGGVIWGGEIWGGEIWGGEIRGGVIRGGVIFGGVIWGGEIWGGEWKESPLQIQGTKHFFNICSKTEIRIGCKTFTFEFWKENFSQIGKDQNYTESEIKEYGLYIDLAFKLYK